LSSEGAPTLMWKPACVSTMEDYEDVKVVYANPIACATVILVKQLSTNEVRNLSNLPDTCKEDHSQTHAYE